MTLLATARMIRPAMATGGGRVTGVDTHAHIFERGLELAAQRRYAPDYDATVDQFLAQLDANVLSHGVLVQPSFLGTNNDYLLAGIARSAGRLRGIVVVAPPVTEDQLDTFAAGGAVGIRLNLVGREIPDLAGQDWQQLLGSLAQRGWQVEVHIEANRLADTLPLLLDSQVTVVVDHFGRPDPKLGIKDPGFEYLLSLGPSRQVWVKLSAPYRMSDQIAQEAVPLVRAAFGIDRLLWGSDWPHTQHEEEIDYTAMRARLETWLPEPAARSVVLADNPAKLFRFS
jgi:predicted TIM-barrel fold metal-dependent hydrolase